jgi:hypothetical protein
MLASRPQIAINEWRGRLAQLVERLLYTQDVGGSSPSPPTRKSLHQNETAGEKPIAPHLPLFPGGSGRKSRQIDSFNSLDARNATFLLALIWICSPVAGLRPMRAARLRT